MTTSSRLLVLVLLAATATCSDPPAPPPGALTERDPTPHVTRPIDGTPGHELVFTRTRDDGWRKVELVAGSRREVFLDDPDLYILDANGQGFGTRTVVCGMATADPSTGANLGILCGVADADGLGPVRRVFAEASAWLLDVCTDDPGVTVLYSVGTRPLDPDLPLDAQPCLSLAWDPATGWAQTALPSAACECSLRDGQACTDPCVLGTGLRRDGDCDLSGLPSACDDGNPATADFCTGLAGSLCYHDDVSAFAPR